jgi:salicylate hydroxylase
MRIAVAGAGIAGLSAALALSGHGFRIEVFERAAELEEVGAGIQLSPNAMHVLGRLGIAEALRAHCVEPLGIDIRDARSGGLLKSLPLGETARRRYGAPYCVVHRADLQSVLLDAVRSRPDVDLRMCAEVHDVRATDAGVVIAAAGQNFLVDILVAADGIHSRLRRSHFGLPSARSAGKTAWRATIAAASLPPGIATDRIGLWLGRGAHLVHYPVKAGTSLNLVAIASESDEPVPPHTSFGPLCARLFDRVPGWRPWPLFETPDGTGWTRGRSVLVGDAAHGMLPSAAQGGAQAIEDAWALGEAMQERPANIPEALEEFAHARRKRVSRVMRQSRRSLRTFNLSGPAAQVRNIGVGALPAHVLLSRFDWLFGWRPETGPAGEKSP